MEVNNSLYDFTVESNLTFDDKNINNIMWIYKVEAYGTVETYGTVISTFFGIFTNILVVATISVSRKFWQHSIGILLLTLACVDIIGNGVCFSYYILLIQNTFSILSVFLNNGFKRLSYLMMILISVNRYALICRPFTHRRVTSQKSTLIQITIITVFAISAGIYDLRRENMALFVYAICNLIIGEFFSVLPLIITCVLTILIIHKFRRKNKTKEASGSVGAVSRKDERKNTRAMIAVNMVTRAMIATNVAFIFLTLPSMVIRVVWHFFISENTNNHNIRLPLICLIIISDLNASINLFIYTLYILKFRLTLCRIFTCKCCRRRDNGSLAMSVL